MINIGKNIKLLRRRTGLTQSQFAESLGISVQDVSKWENGKAKPQVDMLKKLAIVFGVSVESLLDTSVETTDKKITN